MAAEVVVNVSFQPADPSARLAASVARNWERRSASRPPSSLGSFSVSRLGLSVLMLSFKPILPG